MKKKIFMLIGAMLVLCLGRGLVGYSQSESEFKILEAKVISVSEHKGKPWTIEISTTGIRDVSDDALTIDPRCTFYKDDIHPKTLEIVKPGDDIEATYIVKKVKIAFNIIVKPK